MSSRTDLLKIAHLLVALLVGLFVLMLNAPSQAQELELDYSSMSVYELEYELEKRSLGPPIATLAVGGGFVIAGGALAYVGSVLQVACSNSVQDDCGLDSRGDDTLTLGLIGLGVGAAVAAVGGIWLGDRIGERRKIKRALERNQAGFNSLQVGISSVGSGQGFSLRMSF